MLASPSCPASPASTMTRPQPWSITSSATWPFGTSPLWMRTASCPATTMPCAEDCLVPCNDDALRTEARKKIDRYIADHPPVETFPRFYLVLLRQPIAPMESDGMSRVYQI